MVDADQLVMVESGDDVRVGPSDVDADAQDGFVIAHRRLNPLI